MPGDRVTIAHGGGGTRMQELLRETIFPLLGRKSCWTPRTRLAWTFRPAG